ncbi:hypothetical protein AMS68_002600 [Peltaster fructicola]|uniref:Ornithine carbamoyltransferase, mitochondrial n=1 Tax=Peltaster fructicola TaxID=286661 RepID=A0A6H0XQU8_9PEZI|nr:hypothetical protein AMS68_002600 [Peltaster fructicola]
MQALTVPRASSRLFSSIARQTAISCRHNSTTAHTTSPFAPRHFLSIDDLTPKEFETLVSRGSELKSITKSSRVPSDLAKSLAGESIALIFSKLSTRTRVSTEGAVALLGGHPMFLGKNDIQLGVNESLYDSSVVISSMVSGIVARVNAHADVANLAKWSSVPVINALSDSFHPMQIVADFITIKEAYAAEGVDNLQELKISWIGDANNVLYDLALGAAKLGLTVSVATPKGYEIPDSFRKLILAAGDKAGRGFKLEETNVPEEALKDADIVVTDTWVSMGQEEETAKRLKAFAGYQITNDLVKRGGAKENWKFMHCLPRHPDEVADEVFYSPRSLVFPEAENRLWSCLAVLEAFVVNKGKIVDGSKTTGSMANPAEV